MFHLDEDERIDWFRIMSELKRAGVSVERASRETKVPKSTIQGWTQQIGNPRLEVGLRVIEYWARKCKKKIQDVPKHNPYKPYPPPQAPVPRASDPAQETAPNPPGKPQDNQLELNI